MATALSKVDVRRLAQQGLTTREIAAQLRATYHAVHQFSKRHGIAIKRAAPEVGRQKKLSRADIDALVEQATLGESLLSLAKRYGVAFGTVQYHVRRSTAKSTAKMSATAVQDRQIVRGIRQLAKRIDMTEAAIIERVNALQGLDKLGQV